MSYSRHNKRYFNLAWKIIVWNVVSFAVVLLISPLFGDPFVILPLITLISVLIGTSIGIAVFQHKPGKRKRSK